MPCRPWIVNRAEVRLSAVKSASIFRCYYGSDASDHNNAKSDT